MQLIEQAIEALREYNLTEDDVEEKAQISKVIATLRGMIAGRQKEADQAMGIGPREKHVRRVMGS